jgi:hypothetical protein
LAEKNNRECLEILKQNLPKYHPHIAGTMCNLANVLQELNKFEEA